MLSRLVQRQAARRTHPHSLKQCRALSSSTTSSPNSPSSSSSPSLFLRRAITTSLVLVSGTLFAVYYSDSRSAVHRYVFTPVLRKMLDPEGAHWFAVRVLRSGLGPRDRGVDDERLKTELWGETLANPVGLAAGFDKNGEAIDGLFNLGFAWVEIGSVTPKPQPGNPKPRVFHLPEDNAMINRYGFPSVGAVGVLERLKRRLRGSVFSSGEKGEGEGGHASLRPNALLAINLGKNKTSPADSPEDFLKGVRMFAPYADVLVVNVSSPNTPGLRGMQTRGLLEELLGSIVKERDAQADITKAAKTRDGEWNVQVGVTRKPPKVVLKIAPDLDDAEIEDIAEAIKATPGVDGVIVSNTTVQRPKSLTPDPRTNEMGGLSGPPLKPLTLRALKSLRSHLPSTIPIIACGGISTGADALEYAKAGASAVQLYTAFGYDGPGAVRRIKDELSRELEREGLTWGEVVRRSVGERSWKGELKPRKKVGEEEEDEEESGVNISTSLQVLVDEAHAIRKQLENLGERLGEKENAIVESSTPAT
ncbi:uncharacterized protein FOMMEDRAFT_100360 [Fomitiporia mediterranea MF3/22]|uniref:uncharacterized protein n=1 Tax=Fomitiporia mediterranea (strain MF3/22) TaxID=694068 RepID=UPI00044084A6|nr:uncharacterized protein FOMMEDRAFT_100360 [Fomitiporia mediterranea MF3/22]EJD07220.1 hypothetical protein FOMMEDRAFT_100360 [Fomitiporia mediterranea MF3/22]